MASSLVGEEAMSEGEGLTLTSEETEGLVASTTSEVFDPSQPTGQDVLSSTESEQLSQEEGQTEQQEPQTLYVAIQPESNISGHVHLENAAAAAAVEQPAVYVEVVEAGSGTQMGTANPMSVPEEMVIDQTQGTTTEMGTIPTTLLSQVVDQATLSTMQAEMIAVQVLSQSASGDIQYFQQQPQFMTLPPGTDANALSALQATLGQMPIATIQMPITSQGFPATSSQTIQLTTGQTVSVSNTQPIQLTTIPATGVHTTAAGVIATAIENQTNANQSAVSNNGQVSGDHSALSTIQADVIVGTPEGEMEEDGEEGDSSKAKYTCELCGKNYIRSWSYYGHMREHASGDKQHKCEICGKIFNYASNLRQHMLIHTGEKPYECEYCEKAFNNPSSLRSHMMSHSDERPYVCDHEGCNKSFNNPGSLRVHRRVHQEEKPHRCNHGDCDKAFKTPAELARHAFRHSGEKPHKCDQCEKAFIRYDDLKRHYRIHTGEKPFKCDECDFACIQSFDLVKHKFTHSGDKPYKCEICPKQFTRPARLRDHMRTHTGEKPFVCEICGKGFAIQTGLKSHQAVHTGDKPFKCLECDKTFRTQMELQSHTGRHTGVKPFKCEECQKEFISAVTYKRHAVVHSGEKPFECPDCGRRFARSTDLKVHMPVHSDDKPYKCGECEKMFTRFSTLKEHIRTHTGERPFKCDDCGREFNHRSHFNNHLRIHTGEKPFRCEVCGKDFSRKASLRYHMKVHENRFSKNKADDKMDGLQIGDSVQVVTMDGQSSHGHFSNEDEVQLAEALVAVSESASAELEEAMQHQGANEVQGSDNTPGEVQQVMEVHSSEDQTIHGADTVVQVHTVGATGTENIIHASSEAVQNLLQQVIQTFVTQPGNHLTQGGTVLSHEVTAQQGQALSHLQQAAQQQQLIVSSEITQGEDGHTIQSIPELHQQVSEIQAMVTTGEESQLTSSETAKTLVILGNEAMVSTATTQAITMDTISTIDASQIQETAKVQGVALPTVMSVGQNLQMVQGEDSNPEAQIVELQHAAASAEEHTMQTE